MLVPKRGKKKFQHFLYPVNHLNQQKSPSAPLVSKEIETDFFRRRFSKSREKFPKLRTLVSVAGGGVFCRVRSLTSGRECVLGVGEVAGGFWGVCGDWFGFILT